MLSLPVQAAPGFTHELVAHLSKKAWRMDPRDFRRRATKEFHRPQPKLSHTDPCSCTHRQRDHENLLGRCWICGTGTGQGCQRFRKPETRPEAHP